VTFNATRRPWSASRALAVAATCGAALVLMAGCGSDDDDSSSAPAAEQPTAAKQPTGEPIKVMTMGQFDAPKLGMKQPELSAAVEARARAINDAGGIDGRPVEVLKCNFDGNPNRGTVCANDAVKQGVVAVLGAESSGGEEAGYYPIFEKADIPVIGAGAAASFLSYTSPIAFSYISGAIGSTVGSCLLLAEKGATRISFIVLRVPGIEEFVNRCKSALAARNVEFGQAVYLPLSATDMAPYLAKATADGVKDVAVAATATFTQSLIGTAANRGIRIATSSVPLQPEVLKTLGPAAEGVLSVSFAVDPNSDAPGAKQYRADMSKYFPDLALTDSAETFWLATWTFERVARELPEVTAKGVLDAMGKLEDFDMGGIVPPLTTTTDSTAFEGLPRMFNPTVIAGEVKDQKIQSSGQVIQLAQ
jgi:branched-chain amino acid transport system substrate-binding protein